MINRLWPARRTIHNLLVRPAAGAATSRLSALPALALARPPLARTQENHDDLNGGLPLCMPPSSPMTGCRRGKSRRPPRIHACWTSTRTSSASGFDRRPFLIRHRLVDHPLFALPRLMELSRALPADNVEYNAGNIPISLAPELTPRNGLSADETIRRIAECKSWLVLKYVEHDADYRDLLNRCLSEVRVLLRAVASGHVQGGGVHFHHVAGFGDAVSHDPNTISSCRFAARRSSTSSIPATGPSFRTRNWSGFTMARTATWSSNRSTRPRRGNTSSSRAFGLHFPVTAPHYVQNGPEVSISFSITFRTPDRISGAWCTISIGWLRRRGITPAPVGAHPWRDGMKFFVCRALRRVRRLFGKGK